MSETDIFASSTCTTSSLCEPVIILYGLVPVTLAARLFRSSRTVYIFISLRMPVVLLKFPLVAIFVWVAGARTLLMSHSAVRRFSSTPAFAGHPPGLLHVALAMEAREGVWSLCLLFLSCNRSLGLSTPCLRVLSTSCGQHGRRCLVFH